MLFTFSSFVLWRLVLPRARLLLPRSLLHFLHLSGLIAYSGLLIYHFPSKPTVRRGACAIYHCHATTCIASTFFHCCCFTKYFRRGWFRARRAIPMSRKTSSAIVFFPTFLEHGGCISYKLITDMRGSTYRNVVIIVEAGPKRDCSLLHWKRQNAYLQINLYQFKVVRSLCVPREDIPILSWDIHHGFLSCFCCRGFRVWHFSLP